MALLLISASFILLMAIGVPIGTSLGIAAVVTIYQFDLGIGMLGVNFSTGIASFPLLAIPLFLMAGSLMSEARITPRIMRFAGSLVGRVPGGLAIVMVFSCMLFGAISGYLAYRWLERSL